MAPNGVVIRGSQREAGFTNVAQPPPGSLSRQRRNSDRTDNDVEDGSAAQSGSLLITKRSCRKSSTFTVGPDLDVRRFQIAMDDALVVCAFQGVGDLLRKWAAPRRSEWRRASAPRVSREADSRRVSIRPSGHNSASRPPQANATCRRCAHPAGCKCSS
jgi:hypothetical protein